VSLKEIAAESRSWLGEGSHLHTPAFKTGRECFPSSGSSTEFERVSDSVEGDSE